MHFINEAGFYAYLRSTEVSFAAGLVGPNEYVLRLSFLRTLAEPKTRRYLWLPWEDEGFEEEPEPEDTTESWRGSTSLADAEGDVVQGTASADFASPDSILWLLTPPSPTLGTPWLFHQSDEDFFPSVPHGHRKERVHFKLDVYRGHTYDTMRNNKEGTREKRSFIIALWNDEKFRILATNSLHHFIQKNPSFNWMAHRGLINPLILPRYRRPKH